MNFFGYFMAALFAIVGAVILKISFNETGASSALLTTLGLVLIAAALLICAVIRISKRRQKYHVLHSGHSVL